MRCWAGQRPFGPLYVPFCEMRTTRRKYLHWIVCILQTQLADQAVARERGWVTAHRQQARAVAATRLESDRAKSAAFV
jgi:hypothetical protein